MRKAAFSTGTDLAIGVGMTTAYLQCIWAAPHIMWKPSFLSYPTLLHPTPPHSTAHLPQLALHHGIPTYTPNLAPLAPSHLASPRFTPLHITPYPLPLLPTPTPPPHARASPHPNPPCYSEYKSLLRLTQLKLQLPARLLEPVKLTISEQLHGVSYTTPNLAKSRSAA